MDDGRDNIKEVIIVKRRSSVGHDDHHGGVWKIAFADFMTAMMAFFLVLWIVNSTSKETQAAIARHFNPMKITDTSPAPRGLKDPLGTDFNATLRDETKEAPRSPVDVKKDGASSSAMAEKLAPQRLGGLAGMPAVTGQDPAAGDAALEGRMFVEPELVLAEILAKARDSREAKDPNIAYALQFRDPFLETGRGIRNDDAQGTPALSGRSTRPSSKLERSSEQLALRDVLTANTHGRSKPHELFATLKSLNTDSGPKVSAVEAADGILVSLSDTDAFSMFPSGSSKPQARTIEIIDRIAGELRSLPGSLVVRGHTDGRAFKGNLSDNWRLSSARAQVTYFILRRAGIPESRFTRLEGHADRHLARKNEPYSPVNRRIEILLQVRR